MSRCFPYPPPGYTLSGAGKDALIESIKLQKKSEKAKDKEQRKKEKRERKEKRKELKERKKDNKGDKEKKVKTHQNLDKSGIVFGHVDEKLWADTKAGLLHKQCKAESEQVERSNLTEEHEPPVCLHAPSSSSDSTENSNKRKRQCSSIDENRVHGKVIKIRLSKKQNDFNTSVNEQQPCSTFGTTSSDCKDDIGVTYRRDGPCGTSNETNKISHGLAFGRGGEQICSSSLGQRAVIATRKIGTTGAPPTKTAVVTPMQRIELQYKNLFENWVPPQSQDAYMDPYDLDWLFQGKNKLAHSEVRQISGSESSMSCSGNWAMWPCARHLPEVDVYALPFTIPF